MHSSVQKLALAALMLALLLSTASARTYRIGHASDPACDRMTLAQAIAAAEANPGDDTIRVVMGNFDAGQNLYIEAQDLTIRGGYETCSDTDVGLDRTTISAAGTTSRAFTIQGPGVVVFENLRITGGNVGSIGGGISYSAGAVVGKPNTLILSGTVVEDNVAAWSGGGIAFAALSGQPAELVLEQDTVLFRNKARGTAENEGGGGLYIRGNATLLAEAHRLFFVENFAEGGSGGAIYLESPASADIGSGYWDRPTFHLNTATRWGGAIHVEAPGTGATPSQLRLYSILPDRPLELSDNVAGAAGGAISVAGSGPANTKVCTQNINLHRNKAAQSSAVELTRATYGFCPGVNFPASAIAACVPRERCNLIEGHQGNSPNGARLTRLVHANADFRNTRILRNTADESGLFNVVGDSNLSLINSVVAETRFGTNEGWLFTLEFSAPSMQLIHTTIAQPSVTRNQVGLFANLGDSSARLFLSNSVFAFPGINRGAQFFNFLPENVTLENVLLPWVPETHLGNPTLVESMFPQFVSDTDLRLQPTSPAVDFAPHGTGFTHDIDGNPRVDLPGIGNRFGPSDLGAFETQSDAEVNEIFVSGFEPTMLAR